MLLQSTDRRHSALWVTFVNSGLRFSTSRLCRRRRIKCCNPRPAQAPELQYILPGPGESTQRPYSLAGLGAILFSALFPGQPVEAPTSDAVTVMASIELALKTLRNIVNLFKPIFYQKLTSLK